MTLQKYFPVGSTIVSDYSENKSYWEGLVVELPERHVDWDSEEKIWAHWTWFEDGVRGETYRNTNLPYNDTMRLKHPTLNEITQNYSID